MKKIIFVPIEPLEERYSADWLRWFPVEFKKEGLTFRIIDPPVLSDKIRDGSFLDIAGTNYYKSLQTAEISQMFYNKEINDGDIIFYMDIWNPSISHSAYMRDGLGVDVKIVGCIFAGTYDPYDFLTKKGMSYWGKPLEESWFRILDQIYVATDFHKRLIMEHRDVDPKKLIVTGHPTYPDFTTKNIQKENIIVFPHRLDSEKNPNLFDSLATQVNRDVPDWTCVKSKEVCKTKKEYYELLQRAKISVSYADQETWGFAMIESVFADCIPLVPDKLSYSEMYLPAFKFSSFEESIDRIFNVINEYSFYYELLSEQKRYLRELGANAIPNMIECMRKL